MKQHIKKALKSVYIILLICLCVKAVALGIRFYLDIKTENWYILSYASKKINDQRSDVEENGWKEISIENDNIIVEGKGPIRRFVINDTLHICKVQFWKEEPNAKGDTDMTIYDPTCKPLRNEYMKNHPVLFYILLGKVPF